MKHSRWALVKKELFEHLPSTILGVASGVAFLGLFYLRLPASERSDFSDVFETMFHFFHVSHIFLSAITATAIFYRHEKKPLRTFLVVFSVTLTFCGTSDILLPFIGGILTGTPMHFHLCLLEEPWLVLAGCLLGIGAGFMAESLFKRITYFSHGGHVFIASFAALFYLISFGHFEGSTGSLIALFLITTIAVVIPCCSSDIIMPLSFIGGLHGHEHEDEHTH